ncbi:Transcription initiation factor TFIID subunit 4 [Homalodisca vitripennis]|nr:Transcription initiation factor TFIID subunit 4 [Homalodisca vitripennis]KAG8275017.1 Transcription initiation factor TFIID subunit 4 [Homalodisca vitripennis]
MVVPRSINSTSKMPLASQKTVAINFLAEKDWRAFFGLLGEAGGAVAAAVQTQVPALTTQTTATTAATTSQRHPSADTVKEKCRKFLANLLELSSREPKAVERNVRTLIQELVDTKVEPEEFCDRLERLLNASPQPCLIGFLKKSLPLLRQSMVAKELVIDGIRPPPASVLYSTPTVVQQTIQQGTTRAQPQLQVNTPQMRVITQTAPTTVVGTPPRASQPVQHRIVTVSRKTFSSSIHF